MGQQRDLAFQEDGQSWTFSPGVCVCHLCLSDPELAEYVKRKATDFECDFCARFSKKKPCSIAFDNLMELIAKVVYQYYERAVDVMGWDGEDDKYIGTKYDSSGIVWEDFVISENKCVMQAIIDSLGD